MGRSQFLDPPDFVFFRTSSSISFRRFCSSVYASAKCVLSRIQPMNQTTSRALGTRINSNTVNVNQRLQGRPGGDDDECELDDLHRRHAEVEPIFLAGDEPDDFHGDKAWFHRCSRMASGSSSIPAQVNSRTMWVAMPGWQAQSL